MTLSDYLGVILIIEVVLVLFAVGYIVKVYLESRRTAEPRVPRLYRVIVWQAITKAFAGIAIALVLVGFWSGVDTRGWGSIVIGLVVMVALASPIIIAYQLWAIRRTEDEA
jgi:hypothetical protein